jgi:serine/threonine protein kinase
MAEVFKAKAFGVHGYQRILALKRILPNIMEDEDFIKMFIDEARIATHLEHGNIARILELGQHGHSLYIAMEYVQGRDLRELLSRCRKRGIEFPVNLATYIISEACKGLDYAHHSTDLIGNPLEIVHRDVSPQNLLLSWDGAVKVCDFGIAKAQNRAS